MKSTTIKRAMKLHHHMILVHLQIDRIIKKNGNENMYRKTGEISIAYDLMKKSLDVSPKIFHCMHSQE